MGDLCGLRGYESVRVQGLVDTLDADTVDALLADLHERAQARGVRLVGDYRVTVNHRGDHLQVIAERQCVPA